VEQRIAREKFRLFAFRWKIMNKVYKMKLFDRDSFDFMRASLEVQEVVKSDIDLRVENAVKEYKRILEEKE